MNRLLLAAAVAGLIAASSVQADVLPPKGSKRVTLDNKITTEKEFPDYIFFTVVGGAGKGDKAAEGVTLVKFDPKTPIEIKGAGRSPGIGRMGQLVAVPKDAGKAYGSEKEFYAAVRAGKVEGQIRAKANFDALTTVKDTDSRTTVVVEHKVEKVDPKDGIVVTLGKVEGEPAKKDPPPGEEEMEGVTAYTPRGGVWVAGLAATLALALTGVWLARRGRRELP